MDIRTITKASVAATLVATIALGGASATFAAPYRSPCPQPEACPSQGLRGACLPNQWPSCPADRAVNCPWVCIGDNAACPSPFYIDKDGDGVCDNAGQGVGQGAGRGQGAAQGQGAGQGHHRGIGNGYGHGNGHRCW